MKQEITHIKRVIIKKLWRREDVNIDWQLNNDVNVLSGDNGSGKSTVLRLIGKFLTGEFITEPFGSIEIIFNTDDSLGFKLKLESKELIQKIGYNSNDEDSVEYTYLNGVSIDPKNSKRLNQLQIDIISNAEQTLIEKETLQKLGTNISTYLDWEIDKLQRQYANYQIDIGKRVIARLERGENNVKEITASKNLFLDLIDSLFKDTNKVIDRKANDIVFIQNNEHEIKTHQLSTGEKQLLIMLLSALVQDKKPTIMIMDEPELSLHPDWQEKLISNIKRLNPNLQLIIATHSPFMIVDGWMDKVTEMQKITTAK